MIHAICLSYQFVFSFTFLFQLILNFQKWLQQYRLLKNIQHVVLLFKWRLDHVENRFVMQISEKTTLMRCSW